MELPCRKRSGTMRTCERNGVHVDQCSDCRGMSLDRMIDAENSWHGVAQNNSFLGERFG